MDVALKYAIDTGQGIFVILFIMLLSVTVGLVKWVLNKNNDRENRYIQVIADQAEALKGIDGMQKDIGEIKSYLFRKGGA